MPRKQVESLIRIMAAEKASSLDTHVAVGMPSTLEAAGLARRISIERVFRLVLLAKQGRISSAEALDIGLVGEVVSSTDLMPRVREVAAIMAEYSLTASARTKRAICESLNHGLGDGLDVAHKQVEQYMGHPAPAGASTALLGKQPPKWAPYRGTD